MDPALSVRKRRKGVHVGSLQLRDLPILECQAGNGVSLLRQIGQHLDAGRSEEHTSELQSRRDIVCRLLLEQKKENDITALHPKQKKKHKNQQPPPRQN